MVDHKSQYILLRSKTTDLLEFCIELEANEKKNLSTHVDEQVQKMKKAQHHDSKA